MVTIRKAVSEAATNGKKDAEAGKVNKPVHLAHLDQRVIKVRLVGTSALIVHNWDRKAIIQMEDKQQKKGKKGRDAKDPEADFQASKYLDEDGDDCFPARGIKGAIVSAAVSLDDKQNFPKTKIRQALFVRGDLLKLILKNEPNMRTDPVRLNGKTADLRYRAEYWPWSMDVDIDYNASVMSAEQICQLIKLAGFGVGIGEWRPERSGNFGRFDIGSAH